MERPVSAISILLRLTSPHGRVDCFVALLLVASCSVAEAQSDSSQLNANPFLPANAIDPGWRFVRGPTWDGHSPEINLADTWPADGPPVLWTCELGKGYSAIVADAGRVFTQYQTLSGQFVVCRDADTGQKIWEHRYGWPYEAAGVYPGPRATPTIAAGKVYIAAPDGLIVCLDAGSGQPVWSRNVTQEMKGDGTDFGYSCSPTVIAGLVVLPVGGPNASIVALDSQNGATAWKSGDDPASYTPIFPIRFGDRDLLIGYLQNALVICELKTGKHFARLQLSNGYDEHSAWPIYSEPYLWISGPFRAGAQLFELHDAEPRITTVWNKQIMSNDILSSVLIDGSLYGFDVVDAQAKANRPTRGHFRCVDFQTGEVRWSNAATKIQHDPFAPAVEESGANTAATNEPPRIGHASVITADGKLYLLNDTGELIVARANPQQYEELGRVSLLAGEIVWTPPTLHRGRLYVRNHSRAACVYVGRHDLLSAVDRQFAIRAADVPQQKYRDWTAFVLGVEPEFAFDIPGLDWFRLWFIASLVGVLLPAVLVGNLISLAMPAHDRAHRSRQIALGLAFVLGAAGTTAFSHWRGDFVFTWPVCLFVAFQAVMSEVRISRGTLGPTTVTTQRYLFGSVLMLGGFVLICLLYFLACRRFSLVFEWAFLIGFPCAVPFLLLNHWLSARVRGTMRCITELVCLLSAFTAFYWSSVLFLWSKY